MRTFKSIMSWLVPVLIGLIIALLIKSFWFTFVRVDGPSMQPNLQNNERVVCMRHDQIHRGSVIVFNADGVDPQVATNTKYVKRVIGIPGDTVRSKNGNIYVNGKRVNQNYISMSERKSGTGNWTLNSISTQNNWLKHNGATKVPAGEYFVLGDHRSVSNDGRYWGFVPKNKVVGVVKVGFWNKKQPEKSNVNNEYKHYFANGSGN